ncbi:MAG: ABC transporter substrate-binding protein [Clostridiales bacterium]|nr:ABC transporter substrate-binding protein [Clostridiales bacterium]
MKRSLFTLFVVVVSLVILFTGCATFSDSQETQETEAPTAEATATTKPPSQDIVNETDEKGVVTIIDVLGNELTLPEEKPTKIISLTPANTEMLFALGLGEYVIGVDEYSNYPAEASAIDKVGDFTGPNVEAILALEPDLILAGNKLQIDAVTQLKELGLNIAAVEATTYDEIPASIKLVGDLTMTQDVAQQLIDDMKVAEEAIIAKANTYEGEPISSYYILSAGEYGNWTSGPGSLINDMFELIGVQTVTNIEGAVPWMDFSLETLITEDPDILLMSGHAFLTVEALVAMDGYKELTAAKEGKVYIVDGDITGRPSVRIVEALEILYNAIYNQDN